MSDPADRLAQALRDLVNEAVQAAIEKERPTTPPARVVERPKVLEKSSELCPVTEARQQLGGISRTTFYALVKDGELPLVKIGSRSFVQAEALDDFVGRKAT